VLDDWPGSLLELDDYARDVPLAYDPNAFSRTL